MSPSRDDRPAREPVLVADVETLGDSLEVRVVVIIVIVVAFGAPHTVVIAQRGGGRSFNDSRS